jgi:hypothetical protein
MSNAQVREVIDYAIQAPNGWYVGNDTTGTGQPRLDPAPDSARVYDTRESAQWRVDQLNNALRDLGVPREHRTYKVVHRKRTIITEPYSEGTAVH